MTFYVVWDTLETLQTYMKNNLETYVDLVRNSSNYSELKKINTIEIGNDYTKKGKEKPFILLEPVRLEPDDEGSCAIASEFSIDVLIAVESYDDQTALKEAALYSDAFQSLILSDDTLGGEVYHASVEQYDFYPGGTGNIKYVLLGLMLTVETNRS